MKTQRNSRFQYLILAVLVSVLAVGWVKADSIIDWVKLRGYNPSGQITSLASKDSMTDYGRRLFYINHPQIISDVGNFRSFCTENEQTIVLGCYRPGENGIFLYNVTDPQLSGVIEVTAAHEMLHGAYERLSSKDRSYIDDLLQSYYQNDLRDQRIIDVINAYKQTEPNDVLDEMHSVFGTEIADLPSELQTYYKRYFLDRGVVTSAAASYESVFTNLENELKSDQLELNSLKNKIEAEKSALESRINQINADKARLDQERTSGQIAVYNSGVASYNAEVDSYNEAVATLQSDISLYNNLVATYNDLGARLASLQRAIDTRSTPQSVAR